MIERKLLIFQMAAELESFSEAATALKMTQPNVTQQISRLEKELNTALFKRDGRRVLLTVAGKTLLNESRMLIDAAEQVTGKVRGAAAGIRSYRIGATLTAGGYVLPDILTKFMQSAPRCHLDLHIDNTRNISEMLQKHLLDIALIEGPFDGNSFFSCSLLRDELKIVGSPKYFADQFSLSDYLKSGGKFILREIGSGTRYYFHQFLQEHNLPAPSNANIIEANNFEAIKRMVRNGFGLTVISELAVRDELAAKTLIARTALEGKIQREMNFIYLPTGKLKFIDQFIAFCRNTYNS
jgi:DNA-binding transcriptional LysR family regulator